MTDNNNDTKRAGDGNVNDTVTIPLYQSNLLDRIEGIEKKYAHEGLQFPDTKALFVNEFADEVRGLYRKKDGILGVLENNGIGEVEAHLVNTLDKLAAYNSKFALAAYDSLNQVYGAGSLEVVDSWIDKSLDQGDYYNKKLTLVGLEGEYTVDLEDIKLLEKSRDNGKLDDKGNVELASLTNELGEKRSAIITLNHDVVIAEEKVIDYLQLGSEGRKSYTGLRLGHVNSQRKAIGYGNLAKIVAGVALVASAGLATITYVLSQRPDAGQLADANANKGLYETAQAELDTTRGKLNTSEAKVTELDGKLKSANTAKATLEQKLGVCQDNDKRMITLANGDSQSVGWVVNDLNKCNSDYSNLQGKYDSLKERCSRKRTRRSPRVRRFRKQLETDEVPY
ncbi:hypothetical protein HOD05_00365 [Candidatus Woesearchaeota archaeon]|jgi:hypothetical protein|nr:hypothetical protein [Candidatus Woesearchaeota archaeon]MBT4150862.1 hypothetical protein [Candidatus Woesearchaeota archaeon]MBT4246875.1 hypothetical protein [Candidatus Woesearchaeota archaeon]MBT4433652.1 hypothetical protein [Candidatus Woesearchaeota archaeon]